MPSRFPSDDSGAAPRIPGVDALRDDEWGLSVPRTRPGRSRSVGDLARGIRRRTWIIVLGAVLGTAAMTALSTRQPAIYTAAATVEILRTAPMLLPVQDVVAAGVSGFEDMYTQLQWASSVTIADRVARRLSADEQRRLLPVPPSTVDQAAPNLIQTLAAKRQVEAVRVSRLLTISFQHADPGLAARIANLFAEEFIAARADARTIDAQRATEELRGKAQQQRRLVGAIAHSLQEYKERNDVVSLDARRDLVTARLQEVNAGVTQRAARCDEAEARWKLLQETRAAGRPLTDISFIAAGPQIFELQREIATRNIGLAQLTDRYRTGHPRVIEAQAGLAAATEALTRAVRSAEANVESAATLARQALEQERAKLAEQEKESLRLQRLAIEYDTISRELSVNEDLYRSLLVRMNETALVGASKTAAARIIDRAIAPDLLSARRHLVRMALGAVGGVAAGLVLAALLAFFDDRVTSAADAESGLGRPVLGEIPPLRRRTSRKNAPPVVTARSDARAFEAFRDLYCFLRVRPASRDAQVVVITSATPREGKSFVAANLAAMCAAHGEKTLLIDANLRRPVLHLSFGATAEAGLARLESEAVPLDALLATGLNPLLDLLPAGGALPDPPRLLGSRVFADLLRHARTEYRRIIIDAPAASVSDASMLLDLADGCLFVARFNRTRQRIARAAIAHLSGGTAALWGTVLNGLPGRKAARKFRAEQQEMWDPPPAIDESRHGELAKAGVG